MGAFPDRYITGTDTAASSPGHPTSVTEIRPWRFSVNALSSTNRPESAINGAGQERSAAGVSHKWFGLTCCQQKLNPHLRLEHWDQSVGALDCGQIHSDFGNGGSTLAPITVYYCSQQAMKHDEAGSAKVIETKLDMKRESFIIREL